MKNCEKIIEKYLHKGGEFSLPPKISNGFHFLGLASDIESIAN